MKYYIISLLISFCASFIFWLVDWIATVITKVDEKKMQKQRIIKRLMVAAISSIFIFIFLLISPFFQEEVQIYIEPPQLEISYDENNFFKIEGDFKNKDKKEIFLLARKRVHRIGLNIWVNVWTVISTPSNVKDTSQTWDGIMDLKRIDGNLSVEDSIDVIAVISDKVLTINSKIKDDDLKRSSDAVSNIISIKIKTLIKKKEV